ncbi:MAG: UDPGP type 1 family protein, partial [Kiritimatiellae bacterium]|nr:UDPGP type 1 family protein [Kiritimatiellia bacterium]
MEFTDAKTVLETNGQGHVLAFWDTLSADERTALLDQIATLDFAAIARMQGILNDAGTPAAAAGAFEPAPVEVPEGDALTACVAKGEELLRGGKVAALLVAGGQGSRLGYEGPKG